MVHLGLVLEPRQSNRLLLAAGANAELEVWLNHALAGRTKPGRFVADRLVLPLRLRTGRNELVLRLTLPPKRRRLILQTRFLDTSGQRLDRRAVALGLPPGLRGSASLVRIQLRYEAEVARSGYVLSARTPGGLVGTGPVALRVCRGQNPRRCRRWMLDAQRLASRGAELEVGPVRRREKLHVTGPGLRVSFALRPYRRVLARLREAQALLARIHGDPLIRDSVAYQLEAVRRLLAARDPDEAYLLRRLAWARRLAKGVLAGRDPLARARGRIVLAHRSDLDGSLQPFSLWVPPGRLRPRRLYIMLHGMECSHRKGINQMLGVWMPPEDPTPWWRFTRRPPPPKVAPESLVLAPQAFGDAFYRHEGEVEVRQVTALVEARYPVLKQRRILVGHSMGGTGVLELGLKHPADYAGMVSLSGYPSRWIFDSIRKGPLRPWERAAARTWSPKLWVANGRHLPLVAVHGTQDHPERAVRLVEAYRRLGYWADLKLYDYGHSIWRLYLADGQVYRTTAAWRSPRAPSRFTFRTTRLRWHRAYWIEILGMERFDDWAWVEVRPRGRSLLVATHNVTALRMELPARLASRRLLLDGRTLPHRRRFELVRHSGSWRPGRLPSGWKQPGLSGPIDDVFYGPVTVVRGTANPKHRALLEQVARGWARHGRSQVRYPVVPDTQVTQDLARRSNLFLVGSAAENAVVARLADRLPIQATGRCILVGQRRFCRPEEGTLFIFPNPEAPNRYVVVLAANSAEAYLRSHLLPSYLPDWLVYDASLSEDTLPRILGPNRRYVAAGFFGPDWRLSPPPASRGAARSGPPRPRSPR